MSPNNSRSSDEDDLQILESDVEELLQQIHHCRTTFPDLLCQTLDSVLSAHRPVLPLPHSDADGQDGALLAEDDKETAEKMKLVKEKISSNVSAMPTLLKRMRECISRIDNFNSHSRTIHPAFKKRRTSS